MVWLNIDNKHDLVWDYGMCADVSRGVAVRELIARALKGALPPSQQQVYRHAECRCFLLLSLLSFGHWGEVVTVAATVQQVLLELEADPKLVYHCGLTPKKLPVCNVLLWGCRI